MVLTGNQLYVRVACGGRYVLQHEWRHSDHYNRYRSRVATDLLTYVMCLKEPSVPYKHDTETSSPPLLAEAVTRATRGRSQTNTEAPELDLQLLSLLRSQYVRRDKYCYQHENNPSGSWYHSSNAMHRIAIETKLTYRCAS